MTVKHFIDMRVDGVVCESLSEEIIEKIEEHPERFDKMADDAIETIDSYLFDNNFSVVAWAVVALAVREVIDYGSSIFFRNDVSDALLDEWYREKKSQAEVYCMIAREYVKERMYKFYGISE